MTVNLVRECIRLLTLLSKYQNLTTFLKRENKTLPSHFRLREIFTKNGAIFAFGKVSYSHGNSLLCVTFLVRTCFMYICEFQEFDILHNDQYFPKHS